MGEWIRVATAAKLHGVSRQAMYYRVQAQRLKMVKRDGIEFVDRDEALALKFRNPNKKKPRKRKFDSNNEIHPKAIQSEDSFGVAETLESRIMRNSDLSSDGKVFGWLMVNHSNLESSTGRFIEAVSQHWGSDEKVGILKLLTMLSELESAGFPSKITVVDE